MPATVVTISRRRAGQVARDCRRALQDLRPTDAVIATTPSWLSAVVSSPTSRASPPPSTTAASTSERPHHASCTGGRRRSEARQGVNLPEGKNLVGAFWQPRAVLCDTDTLATLGEREVASGHGEMAKYAFLGTDPPGTGLLALPIDEQVARCVALKVSVVASDERDVGRREILNYGHTLAHALEAASFDSGRDWDLRHGEAVAIGLVFAAELACRMGRIGEDRVELHREVVRGFRLSYEMPERTASAGELVSLMARDKKARGDLKFVLDGPHGVEPVAGVDAVCVTDTLVAMGCTR